jgi:hypothetical protein
MNVNRLVAAILAASMIALLVPQSVGAQEASPPRVVGNAYNWSPCGLSFGPFGAAPFEGVTFWPDADEHYVTVHIDDETDQQVAFEAWQSRGGRNRFLGRGCGEGGPFLIEAGGSVTIFPLSGACMRGQGVPLSRPTTGTAWITFSERRGGPR